MSTSFSTMRSSNCWTLKSLRRSAVLHSGHAAEGLVKSVSTHPSHLYSIERRINEFWLDREHSWLIFVTLAAQCWPNLNLLLRLPKIVIGWSFCFKTWSAIWLRTTVRLILINEISRSGQVQTLAFIWHETHSCSQFSVILMKIWKIQIFRRVDETFCYCHT